MRQWLVFLWMGVCLAACSQKPTPAPPNPPDFKIGILTDVQYCACEPVSDRYYRGSEERLQTAVNTLAKKGAHQIINLGDLIEKDWENFSPLLGVFAQSNLPTHHVLGNHDFEISDTLKDSLPHLLDMPARYYALEKNNWMLVFLDGNDLSFYGSPASPEKIRERDSLFSQLQKDSLPQAKTWNGGLSHQQMDWLNHTLAEAKNRGKKVLVFSHFPIFPPDPHNLWNAENVLSLLQKHPQVVGYFSGHNHEGFYAQKDRLHFLGLKAMVNTPDSTAYALFSLYADSLVVRGFGREPRRTLRF